MWLIINYFHLLILLLTFPRNRSSTHACHDLQKEADIARVSGWETVLSNKGGQATVLLIGFELSGFASVMFLFPRICFGHIKYIISFFL